MDSNAHGYSSAANGAQRQQVQVFDPEHEAWQGDRNVGCIDGSQQASTQEFTVALAAGEAVGLDDILVSSQRLPDGGEFVHYGIVAEASTHYEGADFASDSSRMGGYPPPGSPGGTPDHNGLTPRTMVGNPMTCLHVRTLRTDPEDITLPPAPGAAVRRAAEQERDYALYATDMTSGRLPVGLDLHGHPLYADFRYVDGTLGGHVSISGMSGVATKTSYSLFLLHQLFGTPHGRALMGERATRSRAVLFNVKGEDLLHLDRPSSEFSEEAENGLRKLARGSSGREDAPPGAAPFDHVEILVPVSESSPTPSSSPGGPDPQVTNEVSTRDAREVSTYAFTVWEFVKECLLDYAVVSDKPGGFDQLEMVREAVISQLLRHAYPLEGSDGGVLFTDMPATSATVTGGSGGAAFVGTDRETLKETLDRRARDTRSDGDGTPVRNYGELVGYILGNLFAQQPDPQWTAGAQSSTLGAFARRLSASGRRLGHLVRSHIPTTVRGDTTRRGDRFQPLQLHRQVSVVDIHSLHADAQRFVVGALLARIFASQQGAGRDRPLSFIVLDELNKYAPRDGASPIKELLRDIAGRGRSLGVLLIGAQQSAGDVDDYVFRNASLKITGRLDAADAASDSSYRFLSSELRARATRLTPGEMIFNHPPVPESVPVRFPRAPYATNSHEVLTEPRASMDSAGSESESGGAPRRSGDDLIGADEEE